MHVRTSFKALYAAGLVAAIFAHAPVVAQQSSDAPPVPPIGADAYNKTAIINVEAGQSYVRLANFSEAPARNYVDIYGLADRAVLGSFVVDVPPKATVQFQPELMIHTFAPVNWDQPVALYVENGRSDQVWQHIKVQPRTGALEDASVCAAPPHMDYVPSGQVALNVYAGYFSRFASQITVHNFTDKAGRYEARIHNAATGESLGTVPLEIGARQSLTHAGVWYAGQAGALSPIDEHPGSNIEFVAVEDTGARIVVAHNVRDVFSGVNVNLSNPCSIHGGLVSIFTATN